MVEVEDGWTALDTWRRLGITRYAVHPLLDRVWQLRENLSAYDAGYVALRCPVARSLTGASDAARGPDGKCDR